MNSSIISFLSFRTYMRMTSKYVCPIWTFVQIQTPYLMSLLRHLNRHLNKFQIQLTLNYPFYLQPAPAWVMTTLSHCSVQNPGVVLDTSVSLTSCLQPNNDSCLPSKYIQNGAPVISCWIYCIHQLTGFCASMPAPTASSQHVSRMILVKYRSDHFISVLTTLQRLPI